MGTDFLYLAAVPSALAVGLWIGARLKSSRVIAATIATALILLFLHAALSSSRLSGRQVVIGVLCFVVLPVAIAIVGWRVAVATRRPWLTLALSPVGYFLGYTVGVNVWLWCGYPI